MSWDLYLRCGHCRQSVDIGNYTHNTDNMIREASGGRCWGDLEGAESPDVAKFASDVLLELERNRDKYEAMNPPNGWGSRESLCGFLREVREACETRPNMYLHASG